MGTHMYTIIHVVGARPNFMKVAPVMEAIRPIAGIGQTLVHTGQHYDQNMSKVFFDQLGLPEPDVNLGVGSGSHAVQVANVMTSFEQLVISRRPDLVLVYGDVNSTVAAALVCAKLGIRIGHVEAGLRSFDRSMPEEINRLLTDQLADVLFTPSVDGNENLVREGIPAERIHLVGNVMIDTLVRLLPKTDSLWKDLSTRLTLNNGGYALVTLHRPSNVDNPAGLARVLETLRSFSSELPVVFPVHPRTRAALAGIGPAGSEQGIRFLDPLGYLEFLCLQRHARVVITDSGGIQEETTYLGVPCITVRKNTERPVTVSVGTNRLVGEDMDLLRSAFAGALGNEGRKGGVPILWDGKAGERIAAVIRGFAGVN
jgi:UDP-N-acetylglucosamine 2-epimerase (non-hydrolysing)